MFKKIVLQTNKPENAYKNKTFNFVDTTKKTM